MTQRLEKNVKFTPTQTSLGVAPGQFGGRVIKCHTFSCAEGHESAPGILIMYCAKHIRHISERNDLQIKLNYPIPATSDTMLPRAAAKGKTTVEMTFTFQSFIFFTNLLMSILKELKIAF